MGARYRDRASAASRMCPHRRAADDAAELWYESRREPPFAARLLVGIRSGLQPAGQAGAREPEGRRDRPGHLRSFGGLLFHPGGALASIPFGAFAEPAKLHIAEAKPMPLPELMGSAQAATFELAGAPSRGYEGGGPGASFRSESSPRSSGSGSRRATLP